MRNKAMASVARMIVRVVAAFFVVGIAVTLACPVFAAQTYTVQIAADGATNSLYEEKSYGLGKTKVSASALLVKQGVKDVGKVQKVEG